MMAAPAFDAARFIRPAFLSIATYTLAILLSSVTMAGISLAAGNIAQPQSWCVNSVGVFYGCTFTSAVNACAGANAYPSATSATAGFCLRNGTGQSLGLAYYFYSYKPCPIHSSGAGGTCTCNDSYVPDSTGTSCVPANNCPANMSGTPCACIPGGYVPNPDGAGCVEEQYTISEPQDQTRLPDVEPGSPREVTARVTSVQTGQPKQGAVVRFRLDVDLTSGGHDHGEAQGRRSRGAISSSSCVPEPGGTPDTYDCTTGAEGYTGFTFNAPDVSGTHTFTATCISHACSGSKKVMVNVKVDGLWPIPAEPALYAFIGGEADKPHHDNHYLADNALSQLVVLAINYHFLYPNEPVLHLNDASLVWGGLFDKDVDWDTPHAGHRKGTVIDIRANTAPGNIPESLFTDFKDLAAKTKLKLAGRVISAQAKLHCSDGFDPATNCVGDDNRHFHVILLGVDQ